MGARSKLQLVRHREDNPIWSIFLRIALMLFGIHSTLCGVISFADWLDALLVAKPPAAVVFRLLYNGPHVILRICPRNERESCYH